MDVENGILELQEPTLANHQPGGQPLQCFTKISSATGLSSVTTLIVGSQAAVVVDPPFLVPDANAVVEFVKEKTDLPVVAVFCSHHHPDHYFSANPILDAWPGSRFYAHGYVRAGIDREYEEKVEYWPKVSGAGGMGMRIHKGRVLTCMYAVVRQRECAREAKKARGIPLQLLHLAGRHEQSCLVAWAGARRFGRSHAVLAAAGTYDHNRRRRLCSINACLGGGDRDAGDLARVELDIVAHRGAESGTHHRRTCRGRLGV